MMFEKLSHEELSTVEAGLQELSVGGEQCPYWDTCPNKYPGCYQPNALASQFGITGGCLFAAIKK